MVHSETIRIVGRLLRENAVGIGLTIPQIRALYPAAQVRRTAIVEALRHFEEHDLVIWHHRRVRWNGPLRDDVRPLGVNLARLRRDLAHPPQERVRLMAELSDALAAPPRGGR